MTHAFHPESLMMSHGYNPAWSEGAVKPPVFLTSTFVFDSAEKGKEFFDIQCGRKAPTSSTGLIYSRMNNPDLEILEGRLAIWDGAEACASFESGMAAISTVMLANLKPGDLVLYSNPLYGATHFFIKHYLKNLGIQSIGYWPDQTEKEIISMLENYKGAVYPKMVFVETPANPTNTLYDIRMAKRIADKYGALVAVDNTYMGPLWSQPLKHGADYSLYSATKYIGGHSDLVAGSVCSSKAMMAPVRKLRSHLGSMANPWTAWMMMRSLETLKIRMEAQAKNAEHVAGFLLGHAKVEKVYFLGYSTGQQFEIWKNQYTSGGAMISFDIKGGEAECFRFLNSLKLAKLAVSLGSTESLAEHPYSMTHSAIPQEEQVKMGITDKMIRFSVGLENHDDIIWDIEQALEKV
jgi:methionine-gamma-lyase